ncbi:hypothetical protein RZV17_02930 [Xanthomonas cannabis]|uniref:hypothetical protein n=1 Tax=Xanthomonas cannabis TaxID=1885674 RepID=UPI0033A7BB14
MKIKNPLKSARHHWWPECVSKHWTGEDGKTGWLKPDGTHLRLPPSKLGMIGNGHHVKLSRDGTPTPWDESFESEFDDADTKFPLVIEWLKQLDRKNIISKILSERFIEVSATNAQLVDTVECVVSLAVRSPMNREASASLVESLRGRIHGNERNTLIGLNMRRKQRLIADSIGSKAKFVVIFSSEKDFLFGDGFYHNVQFARQAPLYPEILAPITPRICVLICRPRAYITKPRLSTIELNREEVDALNLTVQIYAKNAIFFANEMPEIDPAFSEGEHKEFSDTNNPAFHLIHSIPGVPPPGVSVFGRW